jgi:TPR repeat protein
MSAAPNVLPGDAPRTRVGLIPLLIVAASIGYGLLQALLPASSQPDPASTPPPQSADATPASPRDECLRVAADPPKYLELSEDVYRRLERAWGDACRQALAAGDDDPRLKVALARTIGAKERPEQLALLRQAAAANNAEANYEIYESYKSWDQRTDRPQLVTRAEADAALRRAAELGHPSSIRMLAIRLDRGGIVKRDAAAARVWAERSLANPPKDTPRGSLQTFLAALLAKSDRPDERAHGIELLERLSQVGRSDATAELGIAIRSTDPVRARALLERARPDAPGHAAPALADMLLKGEGGPADPKRALKVVTGHNDIGAIEGARGQFYLDGKLVPRNVKEAIRLIGHAGVWDIDARLQEVQLLAANPDVQIERPEAVLFDAMEAAELDEPGAKAALIDLKLSQHPQFRDRPGGCKLMETVAASGDQTATRRLAADCRNN